MSTEIKSSVVQIFSFRTAAFYIQSEQVSIRFFELYYTWLSPISDKQLSSLFTSGISKIFKCSITIFDGWADRI